MGVIDRAIKFNSTPDRRGPCVMRSGGAWADFMSRQVRSKVVGTAIHSVPRRLDVPSGCVPFGPARAFSYTTTVQDGNDFRDRGRISFFLFEDENSVSN